MALAAAQERCLSIVEVSHRRWQRDNVLAEERARLERIGRRVKASLLLVGCGLTPSFENATTNQTGADGAGYLKRTHTTADRHWARFRSLRPPNCPRG